MEPHVVTRPQIERELHRLAIVLAKEGFDMSVETQRFVGGGKHDRWVIHCWGEGRNTRTRRTWSGVPFPMRHGHMLGWPRTNLRVLDRQPRSPPDVGREDGTELRVVRHSHIKGRLLEQLHPPCPLFLSNLLAEVFRDHPRVPTVDFAIQRRATEYLTQPRRHTLGVVR